MGKVLSKPSLIEALFEIAFDLSAYDYTVEISRLNGELSKDYPEITVLPASRLPTGIADNVVRHRFISKDKQRLVNFGENIISVNTIGYTTFKNFMTQVSEVVDKHVLVSPERKIRRLGLRYINKIDLTNREENDILSYDTKYPDFLKGENTAFEKLYVFKLNSDMMNYRIGKNTQPSYPNSLILDMDIFRMFEDKPVKYKSDLIKKWLDEAHEHIKEAFIGSLNPTFYEELK